MQELQREIDALYSKTFGQLNLKKEEECLKNIAVEKLDESTFQELSRSNPEAARLLLDAAEEQTPQAWQRFQKDVVSLKLKRNRIQEMTKRAEASDTAALEEQRYSRVRNDYQQMSGQMLPKEGEGNNDEDGVKIKRKSVRIVLLTGFESFNSDLYRRVALQLSNSFPVAQLLVFSDRDIESKREVVENALAGADVFFSSLIFDFDQVEWLNNRIKSIPYRFIFESALELMGTTKVGGFKMAPNGKKSGPPPAVKKVLNLFGSGKEEDKLVGYLSFLKVGPKLLKYLPGKTAKDLRTWLTVYSYWNQGGEENVFSMISFILSECFELPESPPVAGELIETPATGCLHPDAQGRFFRSSSEYMDWYEKQGRLRGTGAPKAAVLLYRKHVITEQPYINDLILCMEAEGVIPVPIFINGVEAHTIVRDQLTSQFELDNIRSGRSDTRLSPDAVLVDAVVNTIGFPLVGGPSGTMEGGRQIDVSKAILSSINVPYIVAAPLLIQDMESWVDKGVTGLQSVVLYSLPELDGAIDSVPLGALVGENIYLVPERVSRLTGRIKNWINLRKKQASEKKIAIVLYGYVYIARNFPIT